MNDKKSNSINTNPNNKNTIILTVVGVVAAISLFLGVYLLRSKQAKVVFYNQIEIANAITREARQEAAKFTEGVRKEVLHFSKKLESDQKLLASASKAQKAKIVARMNYNRQMLANKYRNFQETYTKVERNANLRYYKKFEDSLKAIQKDKGYRSVLGVITVSGAIHKNDDITDKLLSSIGIEKTKVEEPKKAVQSQEKKANSSSSKKNK